MFDVLFHAACYCWQIFSATAKQGEGCKFCNEDLHKQKFGDTKPVVS